MISCIIPAHNEAKTVANVVRAVRRVRAIHEIIVVDDGSTDETVAEARRAGARVISHRQNRGKGAAIKTGIARSRGELLLFLDADLCGISPNRIAAMLQPLENDEADFVKTRFARSRGRVTELVVKPLFRVIYPSMRFQQPLSGQFAMRREMLRFLIIDDEWGVDLQILLQLIRSGARIVEVDIGKLKHKKQPLENLTIMSEQVIKTALAELGIIANKHKLVLFDLDRTLIQESSIEVVAEAFGFQQKLDALRQRYRRKMIKDRDITLTLARCMKGKHPRDFAAMFPKLHLRKNIHRVLERLRKRQYRVGIISLAFSPVVEHVAKELGIPLAQVICPTLTVDRYGRYTGEVIARTRYHATCCDSIICKADASQELMRRLEVKPAECIAVGDGTSDACMFRACGLSLAYRSRTPMGDIRITNLAEVLIYAE